MVAACFERRKSRGISRRPRQTERKERAAMSRRRAADDEKNETPGAGSAMNRTWRETKQSRASSGGTTIGSRMSPR